MQALLNREVFRTSRELEYFTEKELILQTGHDPERWFEVVVKELIDNSLDACEAVGVLPEISIVIEPHALTISDNGPGLPSDVIKSVLDFNVRVSSKDAYISPTRGAQGNALKTVLAIPYVLNDCESGRIEIVSRGEQHVITVAVDRIAQQPAITHQVAASVVKNGTCVKVFWPESSRLQDADQIERILQLFEVYSLFNPHASFFLNYDETRVVSRRLSATCPKWVASEPTSVHWYSVDQLRALIAAYITSERNGAQPKTVREFVSEFRGLSGTAKQKEILARAGLSGVFLRDLVKGGDIDRALISPLWQAMRDASKPVKAAALGFIGEENLKKWFESQEVELQTFEYGRSLGIGSKTGLPFTFEFAFAARKPDGEGRHLVTGINWSCTLVDPFRNFGTYGVSLEGLLGQLRIHRNDPVTVVIHLACPRLNYTDRGKSSLEAL
jgi:DNA topoisomerase VI subunit B